MKPRRFELDRRHDIRGDQQYGSLFRLISEYLHEELDIDCVALLVIAAGADGHANVINGGRNINFDFNSMLRELVETEIDLNRPAEGAIN